MSIARTMLKKMIFYDSYRAYNGLNILTPVDGTGVWMIDMNGNFLNYWEMNYKPAGYTKLLPNGNILYSGKLDSNHSLDVPGSGGIIIEKDWNGKNIWEYTSNYLHDDFLRLKNGNTFVVKWCNIPNEIAKRIHCGYQKPENCKEIWGDVLQEVDNKGRLVWQWVAHEHLDPNIDIGCPLCSRIAWPHINSIIMLQDGNILLSLYKNNSLIIINKDSGDIIWRWGMEELTHPYSLSLLDSGNVLLFDSGYHSKGIDIANSRILEIVPYKGDIVWYFEENKAKHGLLFYSSSISSCQKLPNANVLVCEGNTGRIFEITEDGQLVWEYMNDLPVSNASIIQPKYNKLFSAYRYGFDYSGLPGNKYNRQEEQSMPGTVQNQSNDKTMEDNILKRLQQLGY